MEGIGRGGAKSFDAGMSGCQDVRMPECRNAGHDGSGARDERGDGLPDAVEAARVTRGGRASQSFSRGRRPAPSQHSMPRRGARVKGGLGDDGKKVIFAMSP